MIGQYKSTGDDAADAENLQKMLREKGLYKEVLPELRMFQQALSFATTAAYLHNRDLKSFPRNPLSIAPFVVNSTFAIELYLKALARCYEVELRGHDLLSLYDSLPAEAAALIERRISTPQSRGHFFSSASQLRDALAKVANAFVEWRYLHEKESAGPIELGAQIEIGRILHETFQDAVSSTPLTPELEACS